MSRLYRSTTAAVIIMPPKKKKVGDVERRGEIQRQKSPAEFFADNQAIAGFDNYGKSLYTSIRELVENSLVSFLSSLL